MKKRIFAILAATIIAVMMIVPSFATEYGDEPWDVNGWNNYEPNELPSNTEQPNPYTLVIYPSQTGSIDQQFYLIQIQNNTTVNIDVFIQYGTVYLNDGNTYTDYDSGVIMIPFYSTSAELFNIFNDTTEGYVLNNQQLVTMQNYTATQAEVEASYTEGLQSGIQQGLTQGRQEGYELGYDAGYDAANEDQNIADAGIRAVTAAVETPFNVISQWLNFKVLGVNMLSLLISLFAVCILVIVIKAIIK